MIRNMVIMLALVALALATGWAGSLGNRPPVQTVPANVVEENAPTMPAPDLTVQDMNGSSVSLRDLAGRVVVINFWATWCAPCVKEMPALMALAAREKDRVTLLAVSVDSDASVMRRFIERIPGFDAVNVCIVPDPDKAVTQGVFQTYRYPETILIDAKGMMRHKIVGGDYDWLGSEAAALIESLSLR